MAAARVGGTGPSGQLSLRGCSQATVATFDPSTLIRAGCHEADVDAQLGRIGVEKWAVYQPQAQLCKTAGCANHAARGNYRCCALCRQGWWPLAPQAGSLLLGPQFMRQSGHVGKTCCCDSATCVAIGYGTMFNVPKEGPERDEWTDAAGMPRGSIEGRAQMRYWHFLPEHRRLENGQWTLLRSLGAWVDNERKRWSGPVPIAKLADFIVAARSRRDAPLLRVSRSITTPVNSRTQNTTDLSTVVSERCDAIVAATQRMGAVNEEPPRQRQRQQQLNFLVHEQANDAAGLAQRVAELEHELRLKGTALAASESACKRLESENGTLLAQTTEQRARIEALVAQLDATTPVTYELLHTDAQWAKHVGLFTWFKSVESNDAFLAAINLKHGADDPGICTRLRLYAKTTAAARAGRDAPDPNYYAGRPRALEWRSQYLLFSMYVRAGFSQRHLQVMFQVKSCATVSDYISTWAVFLDRCMQKLFPNPTKSQILRIYPHNLVAKFGHAKVTSLMDATDQLAETPNFRKALSALYSTYHSQPGAKFLVACTPLGVVPWSWIPDGYPSSISDPKIVETTKIIESTLRFGDMTEVDKGFLIENLCIRYGVLVLRPNTMRQGQAQQSAEDSALIHKIGNTRMVIEQVNEQGKTENRYFRGATPISQLTLISHIMRICFCMANFKVPYVHGRREASTGRRPCRAANLYLGSSAGAWTFDARPQIKLWGSRAMQAIHAELSRRFPAVSATEVSEMVLNVGEKMVGVEAARANEAWRAVKSAASLAPATITRSAMEQAMVDAVEESLSNVTRTSGVATASADDSAPARCQPSRASKRHRGAQAANNAQ